MSEMITGIRVHRLILQQDIQRQREFLRELDALEILCNEKLQNNARRTFLLENELNRIPNMHSKYAPFTSLLSLPEGWNLLKGFLRNEGRKKESVFSREQIQYLWGAMMHSFR